MGRLQYCAFEKLPGEIKLLAHIIAEPDTAASDPAKKKISTNAFTLVDVIPGKPRLDLKGGRIATEDALYIWERIGFWEGIRA